MVLQPGAQFCRKPEHLSCDLDGEIAILNLDSKRYFGLTDVGVFIWQKLECPTSAEEIAAAATEIFDVERDRCIADVRQFLHDLEKAGLVVKYK